jgi:DNA damage-binding protein 1
MQAYGKVDPDGSRFLLGDYQGNLYIVLLQHSEGRISDLSLERLGQTSIATSISYLDNSFVFIGSGFGDSQLIALQQTADPTYVCHCNEPRTHRYAATDSESQLCSTGEYVQVHDTFLNLGPIVDFCVVDLERQGQVCGHQ